MLQPNFSHQVKVCKRVLDVQLLRPRALSHSGSGSWDYCPIYDRDRIAVITGDPYPGSSGRRSTIVSVLRVDCWRSSRRFVDQSLGSFCSAGLTTVSHSGRCNLDLQGTSPGRPGVAGSVGGHSSLLLILNECESQQLINSSSTVPSQVTEITP